MDLNVLGFNQEKVIKIKNIKIEKRKNTEKEITQTLGIDDLYILNRLFRFRGSLKTINKIIDNKVFFWINYKTLLESMPILDMNTESLGKRFKKYEEMGLIERAKENEANGIKGCFSFVHITGRLEDIKINVNPEMKDGQGGGYGDNDAEVPSSTTEPFRRQQCKGTVVDKGTKNIKEIKGKEIKGKETNSSSKEKPNDYRRHSQNENIQTKEVEQAWKECGLAEYKYTPVENINIAIKDYGLLEIIKAIQRISKSSLMKTKTNIDSFFNKNNDFEQIRKTLNGSYDEREKKTETITATGNINMRYFQ